jgi:hypothetical protein
VEVRRDVKRKRLIRDLDTEINKVLERTALNLTSEGRSKNTSIER